MEKEVWKGVDGFEFYEVSNHGRIKSKMRKITRKNPRWENGKSQIVTLGGKIINGWVAKPRSTCLYYRRSVALRKDGNTYIKKVHQLVLMAFIGDCPKGMECCHIDGNPLNNYYKNLRWGTHKSNVKDSITHGTKTNPPVHIGETHPNATISDKDVKKIRNIKYYRGLYSSLAKKFGVVPITIKRIYNYESRNIK